jgi:hypothetical protein
MIAEGGMPLASRKLHLFLVPEDPERIPEPSRVEAGLALLLAMGVLDERGSSGPSANLLVAGGFASLRVDRPSGRVLYANSMGGVRTSCPLCEVAVGTAFGQAVQAWRERGSRAFQCPECLEEMPLERVSCRPQVALGSFALEIRDVAHPEPELVLLRCLEGILGGGFRVVTTRG